LSALRESESSSSSSSRERFIFFCAVSFVGGGEILFVSLN
jgi:hypothetical protein